MRKLIFVLLITCSIGGSFAQETIKLMHYNLLQYGALACPGGGTPATVTQKNAWLKTILLSYQPDIFTVNELRKDIGYANNIKVNVLNAYNPAMTVTTFSNTAGSDIVNMLFYNENKFGYLAHYAITGNVRDIDVYKLYHKNSTTPGDTTFLWGIVAHLKAGNTTADATERTAMAQDIMAWLNAHPEVDNYFYSGDCNLYSNTEGAYQAFINPNDARRFYDVTGQTTGWSGANYKNYHTQSPRTNTNYCGTTGGMDDRFDFILVNNSIVNNTNGVKYIANSYKAYGNDGVSYNVALNCAATTSVSASVCAALQEMSDHIPVVMQLEFQTTVGIDPTSADGNKLELTILGNPAEEELNIAINRFQSSPAIYQLKVVNYLGQLVETKPLVLKDEGDLVTLKIANYPTGSYVVCIQDENGKTWTKRFIKN